MIKSAIRSKFDVGSDVQVAFKGYADNQNCAVDQWAIKVGTEMFLANLIKPHTAPEGARWLFGSAATLKGAAVWGYKDDVRVRAGFEGHVFVVVHDGETWLVYATKGKYPEVVHVCKLRDILMNRVSEESLMVNITRKRAVANVLNFDVRSTANELIVLKFMADKEREDELAIRTAAAEAREETRKAKVDSILARKNLRVFAAGRFVEAIWVVEGEWQMLPLKTQVILGEMQGELFFPKETFTVFKDFKRGSEPKKAHVFAVGIEPSVKKTAAVTLPQPVSTKIVMFEGQPFEIPTFAKVDDLQAHRAAGLNSGVLRGVQTSSGINLFRVRVSGLEQVTASSFQVIG